MGSNPKILCEGEKDNGVWGEEAYAGRGVGAPGNFNRWPGERIKNCGLACSAPPELPIQGTVLNGFGHVVGEDFWRIIQIGHGPGHFEDTVVGTGR